MTAKLESRAEFLTFCCFSFFKRLHQNRIYLRILLVLVLMYQLRITCGPHLSPALISLVYFYTCGPQINVHLMTTTYLYLNSLTY